MEMVAPIWNRKKRWRVAACSRLAYTNMYERTHKYIITSRTYPQIMDSHTYRRHAHKSRTHAKNTDTHKHGYTHAHLAALTGNNNDDDSNNRIDNNNPNSTTTITTTKQQQTTTTSTSTTTSNTNTTTATTTTPIPPQPTKTTAGRSFAADASQGVARANHRGDIDTLTPTPVKAYTQTNAAVLCANRHVNHVTVATKGRTGRSCTTRRRRPTSPRQTHSTHAERYYTDS